ncbi:helix-turn-helix domain-containing protein [Weissella tructae]|uniref:helix-turn-helix domain-containing protein n=1 Tax=Weissella tructae TaxID=887702 RepID=UPI001BDBBB17|nr:helix-turn-helix transcriptional regulator [Weissella tructae]QVV90854.1 helix-turn-helix transcriptional regulator [Weissella tructae]
MKTKDLIEDRLDELGWTYYRLSKETGIHTNTLYNVKLGKHDMFTLTNTIKIFTALELDLNELKNIDWEEK